MNASKQYLVYFDHLTEVGCAPSFMGKLSVQYVRGKELFAFEYDKFWLEKATARHLLDPDLFYYEGLQFTNKANFGLFMDSAPDRWGRRLIQRREALQAQTEGRPVRPLLESDYLMGVYDETRMGALRFKETPDGPFLNNDHLISAPPWARLRELEQAARNLEHSTSSDQHAKWLNLLLAPGSSLGGARPKASVVAPDKTLWLAKFPKKGDDVDTSAWEYATWCMAKDAGLKLPEAKLERYSKVGATFLVKRFDRHGAQRIHFASAMTLLGKEDGADAQNGASYLDLVQFIRQYGADPKADLHELWTRIVFSIATSNTDDHLRNHGFLYTPMGWRLSPAYDLNPNPEGVGLSLNLSSDDNSLDFDLALNIAPHFQLSKTEANERLQRVRQAVAQWQAHATRLSIPRSEQQLYTSAFRY